VRLLIVEDNVRLARLLADALAGHGFAADIAPTLSDADDALAAADYDAVVLDLGLPDGDGVVWLATRRERPCPPVLALTARTGVEARIAGLDAGADDYMVKPFAAAEVAARLRALLRRPGPRAAPVLRFGPISFDTAARRGSVHDAPLDLTRREADLLELMLRRAGAVVTRGAIESALYAFDVDVTPNAVEAAISRLRRKLEDAGAGGLLHTVRGVGYLLESKA
jgi:two-component system, OmpR family, response regulator QseB